MKLKSMTILTIMATLLTACSVSVEDSKKAACDLWNSKLNSNTPITGENVRAFADLAELDSKYNPLRKAAGQILGAEISAALNQKLSKEEEAQIADYGAQIRQACSN